jgi:colicin import membrane protein
MSEAAATPDSSSLPKPPRRRPRHVAEQGYARALKASFALHVAAIAALIFKSLVFPSVPKPYTPTLRVDMVALPDILKKDMQNLPATQGSKEIAEALKNAEKEAKKIKPAKLPDTQAEPDEMVLHPKKAKSGAESSAKREKKLLSALDRIKALSKIENEVKSKPGVILKGNQLSKGTSTSGEAKEAAEASYFDALRSRLQENWELPVWLARQELSAYVRIFIDSRGRVRSLRFEKPSGNEQFDSAVRKAVEQSQPFPPPTDDVASSVLVDGVPVHFPL